MYPALYKELLFQGPLLKTKTTYWDYCTKIEMGYFRNKGQLGVFLQCWNTLRMWKYSFDPAIVACEFQLHWRQKAEFTFANYWIKEEAFCYVNLLSVDWLPGKIEILVWSKSTQLIGLWIAGFAQIYPS